MTVSNHIVLIDHIVDWIKGEADKRGAKNLFVGSRNNINCALAALLCKRTGIQLFCVHKLSDDGSEREEIPFTPFAQKNNLRIIKPKISFVQPGELGYIYDAYWQSYAEEKNALVVGSFDREEYNIDKPYRRGAYDIMPLADLYKSEVFQLYKILAEKEDASVTFGIPSMKEWVDRENGSSKILDEDDPSRGKGWGRYTGKQRQEVAKAHSIAKNNSWKFNPNLPVCKIRKIAGFVR